MNQQNENMMNLKPLCDKLIAGSRIDPQLSDANNIFFLVVLSCSSRPTSPLIG